MPNKNEIRNADISFIDENEDTSSLKGYAIVYNSLSEPLYGGLFRERVIIGAFSRSLENQDQVCLWGHDAMYVLGRKSANTLTLREDVKGLYFEVKPPNTQWANDLIESVHRGDIKQMSFGFKVNKERWLNDDDTIKEYGMPIREVLDIDLYEISLVAFPAYEDTSVRELYIPTPPAIEKPKNDIKDIKKADNLRTFDKTQDKYRLWLLKQKNNKY